MGRAAALSLDELAAETAWLRARVDRSRRWSALDVGRVVLVREPPIETRVVDAETGAGLSDATIAISDGRVVTVDREGRAQIALRGASWLVIRAPGRGAETFALFGRMLGEERWAAEVAKLRGELGVVKLVPGTFELTGIVVGGGGRPIANASVAVRFDGGALGERTDAGGRFRTWTPAGRDLELTATSRTALAVERVTAEVAQGTRDVTLMIADLGETAGVVLDDRGRPVAGARVESSTGWFRPATTDAAGRFAIDDLDCHDHTRFDVMPPDVIARHGELASEAVVLTAESCARQELVLRLGPSGVTGVVDAEDELELTVRGGDRDVRIVLPPR
jgi:hypothetical protein